MPYTVQSFLESAISTEKLRQLTDDARDGAIDAQVVTDAIASADGTIDGYIGTKYAVPLSAPIPVQVSQMSCNIALFYLFRRRSINVPDSIQRAYDDAIAFLKMVADGTAIIAGVSQTGVIFAADKDYVNDRLHRLPRSAGDTDDEKAGTFSGFDDAL